MSDSETLADILDEMRTHIKAARNFPQDIDITDGDVEDWADRIEAAAKRERGALVAEAEAAKDARNRVAVRLGVEYAERCRECKAKSGNAAALREALEKIVRIAEEWDTPGIHAVQATLYRILEAARAALDAPPRNCDRFRTEEEAYTEFGMAGNAFGADTSERLYRYARWLFALAKTEARDGQA